MKPPTSPRRSGHLRVAILLLAGALTVLLWRNDHQPALPEANQSTVPAMVKTVASTTAVIANSASSGASNSNPVSAPQSAAVPDGKDTNSIRLWAHNESEVQRMLDENDKIHRRQLVVLKETVAAVVERNRLSGEQIRQLTLPGLDGQEIAFEVKRADVEPSGLRGMLYGIVAGRPDSMVTLAFKNRTQAFTIISPGDNLYLDVEPHDPGDVIVKSVDLEKYGAGLCGVN